MLNMVRILAPMYSYIHTMQGNMLNIVSSPGLLDNNPEQIRNKLKISAYVLETT